MVRKTLLSLTLIGVIVMPDIGSAQAGNYDLTGVHNIYHYLVRDMDNSVGDSLDGTYQVKASWPNAYNSLFDWTLVNYEVGDTIGPVLVPLPTTAHLQGFPAGPIAINVDLYEAGNMVITGTYPSIATADCSTAATVPAVTDNATWHSAGDPIVVNNDSVKSSTFGWGFVESGVFANNMYPPNLNTDTLGVHYGDGTANETWGKWTSFYNDDFSEIQTVHMYWEQVDGVSSTYGVDEQGNFNGHFGVTGAFGDRTTIPGLALQNPAINVGTYPMIGGSGHDVNMDGTIDAADGYLASPTLEWGYIFDPVGANGVPFDGDESLRWTGYYLTYNAMMSVGTLTAVLGADADGDGMPDNLAAAVAAYMTGGLAQSAALLAAIDDLAGVYFSTMATGYGIDSTTAAGIAVGAGTFADSVLTSYLGQVLLGQMTQAEALTAAGNVVVGYTLTVLEGLGVNLNDSDHDYSPVGTPYQVNAASDVIFDGVFDGAVIDSNTYTFPTGAQSWAGFANQDTTIYPFSFPGGGEITFTGATGDSVDTVDVYFRFEYNPHPDVNPNFNTEHVTVVGSGDSSYSVSIPAQDSANTYSSFLFYVVDRDAPVTITNVDVKMNKVSPGNGRLVFQVGNVCIPRNQHLEVNAYWVNTATYGVDVDPDESLIPKKFALYDNFPNPFNPTTQIAVDLPEAASTKITVWNIMGQKVATLYSGNLSAGHHVVNFDGRDQNGKQLTSGMYFYRVTAGKYNAIKKMTLLK